MSVNIGLIEDIHYTAGELKLYPADSYGYEVFVHNKPDKFLRRNYRTLSVIDKGFNRIYSGKFQGLLKINIDMCHEFSVAVKSSDDRYLVKTFGGVFSNEIKNFKCLHFNSITRVLQAEFDDGYDGFVAYLFVDYNLHKYSESELSLMDIKRVDLKVKETEILGKDFNYIGNSEIKNNTAVFKLSNFSDCVVSVFIVSQPVIEDKGGNHA